MSVSARASAGNRPRTGQPYARPAKCIERSSDGYCNYGCHMGETRLELRVAEQDGWQVLHVRGEVDVTTTPRVRARLVAMLSNGKPQLIVDLEEVRFLDSSGLGAIVAALKLARSRGG